MPIYCYKCVECKLIFEDLVSIECRQNAKICPRCGSNLTDRYRAAETVNIRPDIEPYYNYALDEWVTSRRDCNTKIYGSGGYPVGNGGYVYKGNKRFYGDEEMFNSFQPRDGGESMKVFDELVAKGLEDSDKGLPDDSPNPQEA